MITTDTYAADRAPSIAITRALTLFYGVGAYAFFFGTFLYLIGFVGNWVVPKSIDTGIPAGSNGSAIAINVLLLALFAVQHTIMARPGFKTWWTRYVPWYVERSTFVLFATAILALTAWQWQPLPTVVWHVENGALAALLSGISLAGWVIVLISTFLIDHFELFGLRQSVLYALGRAVEAPAFKERLFYRWVRHPLMLGFLIAFWFTPVMTQGHLLFAVVTTAYILIALQIEEQTLVHLHGNRYRDYQRRVSMLLPFGRPRRG
jgi:protein-S-isoprenylcysteine O-methyltransferase Ste14